MAVSAFTVTEPSAPGAPAGRVRFLQALTGTVDLRSVVLQSALAALLLAIAFQGTRGLYETSEGRYALAAREMLDSGEWSMPTLDGEAHLTKPPLTYWAMAGGMALAGRNAWGVRLPAVVAHVGTTVCVAAIAFWLFGGVVARWAGLLYAAGWVPLFAANAATTDVYLVLFETAAVAAFVAAVHDAECRRRARWVAAMWFAFGLGFLTKGPPALLPLIPLLVWRRGLPAERRPRLLSWLGLALFMGPGGSPCTKRAWLGTTCAWNSSGG